VIAPAYTKIPNGNFHPRIIAFVGDKNNMGNPEDAIRVSGLGIIPRYCCPASAHTRNLLPLEAFGIRPEKIAVENKPPFVIGPYFHWRNSYNHCHRHFLFFCSPVLLSA
jgi:hypothetical protein